ncbi:MAG: lysophospholipid acyltransferase family protein [Deltaproteobacteria bacterium]|nr:MAG: lysophospholipid acyltransferase family protein [Deltaproteobacteria bacterium]
MGHRRRTFRVRDFAYETFIGRLIRKVLVPLVRLWFSTCRVTILNERIYHEYFLSDIPIVVGTWHRASIYFLYFFGNFRPMIMISQSKDGEMLAQYASGFGVIPARGSSQKGGRDALEQMRGYILSGGKGCATVLDGPRGPAYVAKKGMIHLAKLTGAPLIPLIWSANRVITIRDSWDKTMLPLPWSKVYVAFGEPIDIPAETSSRALEYYRQLVQDQLNSMMEEVDRRCGYR